MPSGSAFLVNLLLAVAALVVLPGVFQSWINRRRLRTIQHRLGNLEAAVRVRQERQPDPDLAGTVILPVPVSNVHATHLKPGDRVVFLRYGQVVPFPGPEPPAGFTVLSLLESRNPRLRIAVPISELANQEVLSLVEEGWCPLKLQ